MTNNSKQKCVLICALLILVVFSQAGYATNKDESALWLIRENGKCGYIDRSGRVIIRPQFEQAAPFQENLAAVKNKGLWGFIDTKGQPLVPPKYESAEPFVDGVSAVKSNGKWGFIDNKGRVITPPQFDWTMNMREGMALVEKNGKYGFIRRDGQFAVVPHYIEAGEFWEGLARVRVGDLWGFIDKTGLVVIEPFFEYSGNFNEGLAQVEKNNKQGYIDKTGQVVIPLTFDVYRFGGFSDELAVIVKGDKYGFINKAGKIVVQPQYWYAWQFQEGAARVKLGDSKWVLINPAGEIVSEGRYDYIDEPHEGMARVRTFMNYGFLDTNGKLVVPVNFTAALPFSEGLAAVYVGGSHQHFNIEGKIDFFEPMSPMFFYSNLSFTGEKVPLISGGKGWGYINQLGEMVIPPQFTYAGSFKGGLAEVQKGNRNGYINKSGKIIFLSPESKNSFQEK